MEVEGIARRGGFEVDEQFAVAHAAEVDARCAVVSFSLAQNTIREEKKGGGGVD